MKNSVFWLNFLLGISAAILILIGSFFTPARYLFYLWVVAPITFLQLVFLYQFSLLRANSLFNLISRGIVIFSSASALFVLSFAFLFRDHVLGALVGLVIAYLCIISYWFLKSGYNFPLKIDFPAIHQALVFGIPLIILGALDTVFVSIDRWMIAANLGITAVGYYALGIMVNNLISMIPGSVASTLYPKMLERFAIRKNPSDSASLLLGSLRIGAIVMLIFICGVSYGLPLIIKLFLPKYLPSVLIIRILVLGSFFYSLSTIAGNYIVSIDRQRWLMVIQIILICLLTLFYSVVLKLKYGILAVAAITAVGYSIYGISYICLGIYIVKDRKHREIFHFMARLMVPFVIMAVLIIVVGSMILTNPAAGLSLQSSVLGFLLTMVVVLPVAWFLNRDGGVEDLVRAEWKMLWFTIWAKICRKRTGE